METSSRAKEALKRRKFWQQHISNWSISGLSQVEYCRQNQINSRNFSNWKRKKELAEEKPGSEIKFIPLTIEEPIIAGQNAKMSFSGLSIKKNEIEIQVYDDFNHKTFLKLMKALENVK